MSREWFGRIPEPDDRDRDYPARTLLTAPTATAEWQYWWDDGWWGDQGATPRCVEYAWWHALLDGPDIVADHDLARRETPWLYCEAQRRDAWDGDCENPQYDGTSVRGAAKALKEHGLIAEYRWCFTVDEIVRAVLEHGPVIMGTRWPDTAMSVGPDGYIGFSAAGNAGHAYVINGVNVVAGKARIKNSWGRGWGIEGRAWITLRGLRGLMGETGAEACVAVTR